MKAIVRNSVKAVTALRSPRPSPLARVNFSAHPWLDRNPTRPPWSISQSRRNISSPANQDPTIYALSSAPGRAAIAVIRISGPACLSIYRSICPDAKDLRPRQAAVRTLYAPQRPVEPENVLDSSALLLYFPAPATVTGEDVLELHVHGGPAVVKAVLRAVSECASDERGRVRYAEPGEFTKRAFVNRRLDLTQVEALGDVLAADTEQQRRLSVRGTGGALAEQYERWRNQLLHARGELEALIDFSEDQHFDESPSELMKSVAQQIGELQRGLQIHRENAVRGELLRHGITVSLLGAPNAGKSSLLNTIVGREAAIVSNEAGTTRDIVEIGLDLGGYFCRFGDTAGLRKALLLNHERGGGRGGGVNQIEQEGMRRAKKRAKQSDIVVVVLSFEKLAGGKVDLHLDAEVCSMARRLVREKDNVIVAINKADLTRARDKVKLEDAARQAMDSMPGLTRDRIHFISCIESPPSSRPPTPLADPTKDARGIQAFLQALVRQFARLTAAASPVAGTDANTSSDPDASIWQESLGASERHRVLLEECITHLDAFLREAHPSERSRIALSAPPEGDVVLAAESLRAAADCLAKITGRGDGGDVEEVLGVVFEKFCVGK
jgi:tRNA modification GTPase TrmE